MSAPVARLSVAVLAACPRCGRRGQWRVGPDTVSCDNDLVATLRAVIATPEGWDGWVPIAVHPLDSEAVRA